LRELTFELNSFFGVFELPLNDDIYPQENNNAATRSIISPDAFYKRSKACLRDQRVLCAMNAVAADYSMSGIGGADISRYSKATSFLTQRRSTHFSGVLFVIALHLLLVWALVTGTAREALNMMKKPLQAVVIQEVTLPPPPPPPPPQPRTKELLPAESPTPKTATPMPLVQPDLPVPQAQRPMEMPPEPVQMAKSVTTAPPLAVAAPVPANDTSKALIASMESEYIARLRVMLNATKRYPTGRQASQQRPQGSVKVWFTLARNGSLIDVGVLQSSDSNLLDDAALASVRRGVYPPFPEHTWPGQDQHKFSADMAFSPPSAG
jgi:protein TonB